MTGLSRRSILRGIPVAATAAVIGAGGFAAHSSALRRIYDDWADAHEGLSVLPLSAPDEECEPFYDRIYSAEDRATKCEAATLEDLAYRILLADGGGGLNNTAAEVALVEQARRIIA